MKFEGQGRSEGTSGPWDTWLLWDQEHESCSPLSFQLQGMVMEETRRTSKSILGGNSWGTPVLNGEKDLCTGVQCSLKEL